MIKFRISNFGFRISVHPPLDNSARRFIESSIQHPSLTALSSHGYPQSVITDQGETRLDFKDRTLGLIIFGVAHILIGVFCALLIPLMFLSVALSNSVAGGGIDARSAWSASALYGFMAVTFVWLGLGSIRARRWARELILSLSRIWLLTGICSMVIGMLVVPAVIRGLGAGSELPREMALFVILVIFGVIGLLYVVLPVLFVLFYRSPHVVATCRARHPEPQWVDACPRRLLTLMVVWILFAVSALLMPAYNFFFPFFGIVLTGAAGAVLWALVLALCVALAIGTCKRALWAWWGGLALTLVFTLSSTLVALRFDLSEIMGLMKLPADQIAMMDTLPMLDGWVMVLGTVCVWGTFILYLMTLRRYFAPAPIDTDA